MAKAKSGAPKKKKIPKKSGSKAKTLSKSHAFAKTSREHPHKAKVSQPAKGKAAAEKGKGSARAETSPRAASKETTREMHGITPEQSRPLATKLPALGRPLTKREMEQLLTAGEGRGVVGEGSLKGNLTVKDGFPYLEVVGRDKRELVFLLQGPDQEVLPAYVDHKVSVSGFIRKTTNYGGTVDVRKYSAKKPAPASGMGAGMRGFGSLRGDLEMTGEDFFLVVSNAGTRQQVSFLLQGKAARGMRKQVGQTVQVTGVIEKSSGWGGVVQVESFEPRSSERRGFSRESLEVVHVEGASAEGVIETRINQGLTVRLPERAGYIWAIEPTMAKRVGLREANYQPSEAGPGSREFFFTPRNTGVFEIDFFLAKAFSPSQVSKTFKLSLAVKP